MFIKNLFKKILPLFIISYNMVSCSFLSDSSTYSKKTNHDDKITITWNDGNGNEIYSEKVNYGDMPVYSSDVVPIKNPTTQYTYVFNNDWSPQISKATTNMVYTAQFDANLKKYRVNWFDNDHLIKFDEYAYGDLPSFDGEIEEVRDHTDDYEYRFSGWEPALSAVTGNIDYHIKYEKVYLVDYYTLTFEFNNGSSQQVDTYKEGDTIIFPTNPTKPGYEFLSWDQDITQMPDYNLTIRALYSLTAPGLYIYNNITKYRNKEKYDSYVSFNNLVNSDYITLSGNQITDYSSPYFNSSSTRVLVLILPSTITSITSLKGITRLIELHVNTNTTLSLSGSCFENNLMLESVFFSGEGIINFPGYSSLGNINAGNFNKSNSIFNECKTLIKVYFTNNQKILSTGSIANNYSTISFVSLPSTLTNLYYYEFYNTKSSSSGTNNYEFISGVGINSLYIPETVKIFHYINSSNPIKLLTDFVFGGGEATWNSISKSYYYYKNDTSLNSSTSLPENFRISYSK